MNEDDVKNIIKINTRVKSVSVTLSKSARSLHPSYLHPRTNRNSKGSNWMRIHYSDGFMYYFLWISLLINITIQGNLHVAYGISIHKSGIFYRLRWKDHMENFAKIHIYTESKINCWISRRCNTGHLKTSIQCANLTFSDKSIYNK